MSFFGVQEMKILLKLTTCLLSGYFDCIIREFEIKLCCKILCLFRIFYLFFYLPFPFLPTSNLSQSQWNYARVVWDMSGSGVGGFCCFSEVWHNCLVNLVWLLHWLKSYQRRKKTQDIFGPWMCCPLNKRQICSPWEIFYPSIQKTKRTYIR